MDDDHSEGGIGTSKKTAKSETLYRIGDLAEEFDVTLRTLRFYEDKGLLSPKRVGVTRLFSKRDRARLKLILLGKRVGFSLAEVKRMIDLYDPDGKNLTQLRVAIEKGEKQMESLLEQRRNIDLAIDELSRTMDVARSLFAEANGSPAP